MFGGDGDRQLLMSPEAIAEAVVDGNVSLVHTCLGREPGLVESRELHPPKRPLLGIAASRGDLTMVQMLLRHQSIVDGVDNNERTALHWAVRHGHDDVLGELLAAGADIGHRDETSRTPLMEASRKGRLQLVHKLLRHSSGHALDEVDAGGRTALWWACYAGREGTARALCLHGADHTMAGADPYGTWTPMEVADRRRIAGIKGILQWWEGQLERAYYLHRARYLLNLTAVQGVGRTETPTTPSFLEGRLAAGRSGPIVKLSGICRASRKQRNRRRSQRDEVDEERNASLAYVLEDLPRNLFGKLMEDMHLPAAMDFVIRHRPLPLGAVSGLSAPGVPAALHSPALSRVITSPSPTTSGGHGPPSPAVSLPPPPRPLPPHYLLSPPAPPLTIPPPPSAYVPATPRPPPHHTSPHMPPVYQPPRLNVLPAHPSHLRPPPPPHYNQVFQGLSAGQPPSMPAFAPLPFPQPPSYPPPPLFAPPPPRPIMSHHYQMGAAPMHGPPYPPPPPRSR